MRIIFYPYKIGSRSCGDTVAALRRKINDKKILRVRPDGLYRPRANDAIINWGNSNVPNWWRNGMTILNSFDAVAIAVNKLETFRTLSNSGVSVVPWTTDREVAMRWPMIVERHRLEGYGGEGIEINTPQDLGHAPLYTKFLERTVEYRVHVFQGEVIDYTKKIKRVDGEVRSRVDGDRIKNNVNGWEFIRDVAPRESVQALAIEAVQALGLDFGAVDIIRSDRVNYVLEVGTAPGLSPMGVEAYSDAIIGLVNE